MTPEIANYSGYVYGAYLVALMVYGGSTLLWQARLRKLQRQLKELEKDS